MSAISREARINLSEGLLSTLIPQLIDGRLDFAVALANPENLPFEIAFEAIVPVASAVAGRRDHPLAGARTWKELRSAKWVLNLAAGSQGSSLIDWLRQQGMGEPNNTIRCDSPLLMLELMQRTDRLSIGPAILFSDPLVGHGIRIIDVQPLPAPMTLGLISLRGIPLSRAARKLAGMIARHIRNSPPMA